MINIIADSDTGMVQMKLECETVSKMATDLGLILASVLSSVEEDSMEAARELRIALAKYLIICVQEGEDAVFRQKEKVSFDGNMLNLLQDFADAKDEDGTYN